MLRAKRCIWVINLRSYDKNHSHSFVFCFVLFFYWESKVFLHCFKGSSSFSVMRFRYTHYRPLSLSEDWISLFTQSDIFLVTVNELHALTREYKYHYNSTIWNMTHQLVQNSKIQSIVVPCWCISCDYNCVKFFRSKLDILVGWFQ